MTAMASGTSRFAGSLLAGDAGLTSGDGMQEERREGSTVIRASLDPTAPASAGIFASGTHREYFSYFAVGSLYGAWLGLPSRSTANAAPRGPSGDTLQVLVRDNNIDQALRVLKKKMQREGLFREMKARRAYEKPSEKRVRLRAEAVRRAHKLAKKRAQREGLLPKPAGKAPPAGRPQGRA